MLISSGIEPSWFGDGSDGNVYLTKWSHLATTVALPAYTVGPPGTLTANANGNLVIDGGGTSAGLNLLVKNQAGALQVDNGLYVIVQGGSGGTPWILTRHSSFNDSNADGIKQGTAVHINSGNSNIDTIWRLNNKLVEALVGSTANVSIAAGALPIMDGVQVEEGNRVFLKDQTANTENGVYIASTSGWTRVPELNADAEFANNIHVYVDRGTTHAGTYWRCDQLSVTVDSTPITFSSSLDAVTIGTDRLTFSNLNSFFAGPNTFSDNSGIDALFNDFVIDMPDPDNQAPRNIHFRGYKFFCKNNFSITVADAIFTGVDHIKLHNDGQSFGVAGGPQGSLGGGTSGGASVTGANDGIAGGNNASDSALGRGGGDGGDSGIGLTGGNGGGAGFSVAGQTFYRTIPILYRAYNDALPAFTGTVPLLGGSGGGSGAANGGVSGLGGGGGGILWICAAKAHINAGNQTRVALSAKGGDGDHGTLPFSGGGGGGGGGAVILLHGGLTKTGTGTFALDATGGTGGDGAGNTIGKGGEGGTGGRTLLCDMARGEIIEVLAPNGVNGTDA